MRRADAQRLAPVGSTLAQLTLVEGKTTEHLSLELQVRAQAVGYWSDGGLQCSWLGAYEPDLVAPNFRVTPAVRIDVRPWVAWYTPADGWRWRGVEGVNASRWYRWTATPDGVAEWKTPTGATNPWTWAPIYVHPGQGTYAIAVFEVIYWYSHPSYVWRYAPSSSATSTLSRYCGYP